MVDTLVPTADNTTITLISQINYYNDTYNICILSTNLLMYTPHNRCKNSYTNLLNWNQDGHRRVWYDVIFVCKASKKKYSKGNREQRFWTKKISEKYLFLSMFFWLFSNMQGYFLKFSVSDSSWLDRSGGLLILFSWLSFSEPISIYILLNPSLSPFMTEADII